jgi:lon-related putative ATP-dependent protease
MKNGSSRYRLSPDKLRWICEPSKLPLASSTTKPSLQIIGQERALDALRMGLEIRLAGYHIFVTGTEGTGRTTTIRRVLEERKDLNAELEDLCYVFNFENFDQPVLLRFPAGEGRDFAKRMETLVGSLRRHIPQLYRGEDYQRRISRIESGYRHAQSETVRTFSEKARRSGFGLVETQSGPYIRPELRPVVDGEDWDISELDQLVEEGRLDRRVADRLEKRHVMLTEELKAVVRANTRLEESFRDELSQMEQSVIRPLIHDTLEMLKSRYEYPTVHAYLEAVENALIEETWVRGEDSEEEPQEEPFYRYFVNVVVDNSKEKGSPVIIESTPTFQNLFGSIELRHRQFGPSFFDYRLLKVGSIARAQGGTLVIMAQDLLEEGPVWPTLKRVLRNRKLQIQAYDPQSRMVISPLKPEPIDLDVKVILVGDTSLYTLLLQDDADLQRVFRIKVDFETEMPRNRNNIRRYMNFMKKVQKQDGLLPVGRDAAAAVLEFGTRMAGRKDRLSTRFSSIVDVLIESDYFAKRERAKRISGEHVEKALAERKRRLGQTEEHFLDAVREGKLLIDTKGKAVGQVNGLFVLEQWDYAFGQPVRVTATASLGDGEIISIEREAELSGSSFDKGHFILSGFLRHRFAQDKPLSLEAAISCEQNYIGVDGDSASVTEIFALMSALSGLPVCQCLAVTGSVNQFGEVQPIGGANVKIEGFFRVCRDRGLTGEQGVIIPAQNVNNLMLDKSIVEAADKGLFHIYAIKTVDQGLELLTGVPAGKRRKDGSWTPGSVNALVDERLREMAITFKRFGEPQAAGR